MSRIVRLTESDLTRIVRRVIMEQKLLSSTELLSAGITPGHKYNGINGSGQFGQGWMWLSKDGTTYEYNCDGTLMRGQLTALHANMKDTFRDFAINYCSVNKI